MMNFWSEKTQTGEGINNPDDAKYLFEEIGAIEDLTIGLELTVTKLGVFNDVLEK
jgi:hypothetical protein